VRHQVRQEPFHHDRHHRIVDAVLEEIVEGELHASDAANRAADALYLVSREGPFGAEAADGSKQARNVERRAADAAYKDLLCGGFDGAFGRDQRGVQLQQVAVSNEGGNGTNDCQ
jgi:hypothetical protein